MELKKGGKYVKFLQGGEFTFCFVNDDDDDDNDDDDEEEEEEEGPASPPTCHHHPNCNTHKFMHFLDPKNSLFLFYSYCKNSLCKTSLPRGQKSSLFGSRLPSGQQVERRNGSSSIICSFDHKEWKGKPVDGPSFSIDILLRTKPGF